jgi:hypothetical protein
MVPTAPFPCTCQAPPVVDLSASSCSVRANDVSCLEGRQENDEGDPSQDSSISSSSALLLKRNLQNYGWTHLVVDVPECPPPTQSQVFHLFEKQEKKEPQSQVISTSTAKDDCDDPGMTRDNDYSVGGLLKANFPSHVQYRTSESGGTMAVEPKESLEISTANCDDTDVDADSGNHASDFDRMASWCRALQTISQIVRQALQLPPHVLLYEQQPILPSSSNNETDQGTMLDLMRVFYYHRVESQHLNLPQEKGPTSLSSSTIAEPLILGSSPHTDWGSFTVVWQDRVGGLQTYCAACQTWNNVKATSSEALGSQSATPRALATGQGPDESTSPASSPCHRWECIVHVGDMTSLAMMLPETTPVPDPGSTTNANINHCPPAVQWPSPRHRVVSSSTSERASLVYFGYPPSHVSLDQVQRALKDWSLESRGSCLPYNDYYLLKNQSDGSSTSSNNNNAIDENSPSKNAQQVFHSMKSRPLGTVVMEKWQQVQR